MPDDAYVSGGLPQVDPNNSSARRWVPQEHEYVKPWYGSLLNSTRSVAGTVAGAVGTAARKLKEFGGVVYNRWQMSRKEALGKFLTPEDRAMSRWKLHAERSVSGGPAFVYGRFFGGNRFGGNLFGRYAMNWLYRRRSNYRRAGGFKRYRRRFAYFRRPRYRAGRYRYRYGF